VEANLDNFEFTHEQLIDALNTSKSTLYRKIKSLTGLAPSNFVRNIRLKHARLMLQNDKGNISDIAYSVGLKAEFGLTPREYIKKKKPGTVEEVETINYETILLFLNVFLTQLYVDASNLAQAKFEVKGKVFDTQGKPLIGITVTVKDSNTGRTLKIVYCFALPNCGKLFQYQ